MRRRDDPDDQADAHPGRLYEVYTCLGRTRLGVDHCSQGPIPRTLIDTAVWEFFEHVALDVDATRAAITGQTQARLAELDALRDQAQHDAAKAQRTLAKVKRDYLEGDLSASAWQAFHDDLTADLDAARPTPSAWTPSARKSSPRPRGSTPTTR